ncbi:MAG TPA: PD-(D/E)XK nuclease family protein [Candidatus Nanoarchaeia archaeon]|nr:PD-(D/E)XK nuclease family protein [Candidatus Nanoarchaeia archaeon]
MPNSISPSTLSIFKDCPRCFWLQFNKGMKRPQGIFPSLPSGVDRILKVHFDAFRDRKQLPPELRGFEGYSLFNNIELLSRWRENFVGLQWTDTKGNLIRGAIDNLLQKGSKLIVIDYKTRGYPLKGETVDYYTDQMNIYNFLLRKNGFDTEDYSYLLFYHPTHVAENGNIVFHTDIIKIVTSVKDAQQLIDDALSCLSKPMPESRIGCAYCAYICNAGKTCDTGQARLEGF